MENLFRFILKYHLALMFVFLESVSLAMVYRSSFYKNTVVVGTAENLRGSIKSGISGVEDYFSLKGRNTELSNDNLALVAENLRLKSLLNRYYEDYERLDTIMEYQFIPAHVVDVTLNKRHNTMMLDAGRSKGIERNMGVISAGGIVGIVDRVSENFCTVVSLLNPSKEINAKLKKSGFYGPMVWDGSDINRTEIIDIPSHAVINRGDSIVSSGHSLIFPEGIFIGVVDTFHTTKTASYRIRVKLNNDFKSLHEVYVIKNFYKQEFDILNSLNNNKKSEN